MTLEHVHISRGNTKLGADIPSVNLPAGCTCREDAPCFKKCYARKGRFSFPHNRELVEMNLRIWQAEPTQYQCDVMIAAFKSKFFRWHSSGDIPDAEYLQMMVDVAKKLPDTKFLCFTKKYELVNAFSPVCAGGTYADGVCRCQGTVTGGDSGRGVPAGSGGKSGTACYSEDRLRRQIAESVAIGQECDREMTRFKALIEACGAR